jgi:hypothetical protein
MIHSCDIGCPLERIRRTTGTATATTAMEAWNARVSTTRAREAGPTFNVGAVSLEASGGKPPRLRRRHCTEI